MKIYEIENSFLAKLIGYNITLYPFVLYKNIPTREIRKHEMAHVEQIQSIGFVKFYLSYLGIYIRLRLAGKNHIDAYKGIPYEIEAYAKETET